MSSKLSSKWTNKQLFDCLINKKNIVVDSSQTIIGTVPYILHDDGDFSGVKNVILLNEYRTFTYEKFTYMKVYIDIDSFLVDYPEFRREYKIADFLYNDDQCEIKEYDACIVTDLLLLGSGPGSIERFNLFLEKQKIDAIINVSIEEFSYYKNKNKNFNSEVFHYPINESKNESDYLLEAVEKIKELHDLGKRVFLHCSMGINRSVCVAMLYLIKYHNYTIEDSFYHLREKRKICPAYGMLKALYKIILDNGLDIDPIPMYKCSKNISHVGTIYWRWNIMGYEWRIVKDIISKYIS